MSLLSNFTPGLLLGSGLASLAFGASRNPDTGFKPIGTSLVALALICSSSPALADQFVEAADGARIDCTLSRDELTRISLVGDSFANVSKIASGYPYNDFGVTHEPLRGDIYISVPPSFAANSLSFFATSKGGFVYKFACRMADIEAHQLFVTNPALSKTDAEEWEASASTEDAAIDLIQAMASNSIPPGYQVRQKIGRPVRSGRAEVQLIAEYRGSNLTGQQLDISNRGKKPLELDAEALAPKGALAISLGRSNLAPGETTAAFLVKKARSAAR